MIEPRYDKDGVTLYCGDCLEILPQLEAGSIDAVITDPPYFGNFYDQMIDLYGRGIRDCHITRFLITNFFRITGNKQILVFPGKNNLPYWYAVLPPTWTYIWKNQTQSMGGRACMHQAYEPILSYNYPIKPTGSDILQYPIGQPDQKNGHPWPKPLKLMTYLVGHWSGNDSVILDPFMGSGTTGVAAVQLGRQFIGIEIDETYYAIAEKRIREAQMQLRLGI